MTFFQRSPDEILSCGLDPIEGGMVDRPEPILVSGPSDVMMTTGFMNPDAGVSGWTRAAVQFFWTPSGFHDNSGERDRTCAGGIARTLLISLDNFTGRFHPV